MLPPQKLVPEAQQQRRALLNLRSGIFVAGALFLLALAVRLPYLGSFITIDEIKWLEGAGQFLLALHDGDLARTYWHFHPGITITWGEAFILWLRWLTEDGPSDLPAFVTGQLSDLARLVGPMRLSGVFITALAIPAMYLLARRWLNPSAALLGAALLALDPFFTAHSRIVNGDAGAAAFMFLSVLAFLPLWQSGSRYLALLSGIFGGLALLTKLPSPILIPWIGLLAGLGYFQRRSLSFWLQALLLWGLSAAVVFVSLWPAMWVAPLSTLNLMYHDAFEVGEVGEGHETFFMNSISDDPGWFFYPVAIAFRLTPVISLGLILFLIGLSFSSRSGQPAFEYRLSWTLVAYILFIIVTASVSPKKLDRYVMAAIPPLVFLAAQGFTGVTAYLAAQKLAHYQAPILALLALLQLVFLGLSLPYYLTYYNPLLGGVPQAARQVPVGWGEGLEQAALWLNAQPNAPNLKVSAWYNDAFQPYFAGQEASFSDDGRAQLAADYVVFYINQTQRQKPYPGLVRYFTDQEPVFVVAANPAGQILVTPDDSSDATPWVKIYKAPAAQSASGAPEVEGIARLLAYKIEGSRLAGAGEEGSPLAVAASDLLPEEQLLVTLFLQVLGPLPEETTISAALLNGERWGRWEFNQMKGEWAEDQLVEWHGTLTLPADIPAGDYKFWVAYQFKTGEVVAEFPIADKDPKLRLK